MGNSLFMHVVYSWEDLSDDWRCFGFTEVSSFLDIVKQVSSFAEFKDKYVLLAILENLIKFDDIWVIELNRNWYLSEKLTFVGRFCVNDGWFDDFGGSEEPSVFHLYFIDWTICAFTYLLKKDVVFKIVFFLDLDEGVPVNSYSFLLETILLNKKYFF